MTDATKFVGDLLAAGIHVRSKTTRVTKQVKEAAAKLRAEQGAAELKQREQDVAQDVHEWKGEQPEAETVTLQPVDEKTWEQAKQAVLDAYKAAHDFCGSLEG